MPHPLTEQRKANLRIILQRDFESDREQLAKALGKKASTIASWFSSGHSSRPISDKMARATEASLGLDQGDLDKKHGNHKNIYFVMVSISGYRLEDFIKRLRQYSGLVQEASALFGEMDVFIKVEADEEEFQDFILHTVHKFPGVKNTQTFMGLSQPRWQIEQEAIECIDDAEALPKKYIDRFIEQRIGYHYGKIDEMDKKGAIRLGNNEPNPLSYMEILQETSASLRLTQRWLKVEKEKPAVYAELRGLEKEKIEAGLISRRIILLGNEVGSRHIQKLRVDIERYQAIGCHIRILFERDWSECVHYPGVEGFNIFDDTLLTINKRQYTYIHYHDRLIQDYIDMFESNWGRAKEGEQMEMVLRAL